MESNSRVFLIEPRPGSTDLTFAIGQIDGAWRWSLNGLFGSVLISPEQFNTREEAENRVAEFRQRVSEAP